MDTKDRLNADQAIQHLWEKLNQWWDALILRVPNILIALVIIVFSVFIAKFFSRLLRQILRKHLANQSMRRLIVKLIYSIILSRAFSLPWMS